MTCDLQKKPAVHLVFVYKFNVVRAKDSLFALHQVTMSGPGLLLAIFILFGLVLSADSGNRFVMLYVQFILQTQLLQQYMNYVTVSMTQEVKCRNLTI